MPDVVEPTSSGEAAAEQAAPGQTETAALRKVLNAGSGVEAARKLHEVFRNGGWQQIRLDIDPGVKPDLVGSITDLAPLVPDASFDAVWSSHSLEHLYAHEVPVALSEFHRVLKRDGFLLINCPDLEAVAQALLSEGVDETLYVSPAGPVTALDILFGHGPSISAGNRYMAHRTGFTIERLGRLLMESGFAEARIIRQRGLDLWAVALMPDTAEAPLIAALDAAGLDFQRPAD